MGQETKTPNYPGQKFYVRDVSFSEIESEVCGISSPEGEAPSTTPN